MSKPISITTIIHEPLLYLAMRRAGCTRGMPYSFVLEKGLGERIELVLLGTVNIQLTFKPKEDK